MQLLQYSSLKCRFLIREFTSLGYFYAEILIVASEAEWMIKTHYSINSTRVPNA